MLGAVSATSPDRGKDRRTYTLPCPFLPQLNPNVIIEVNTANGKIVYCNPRVTEKDFGKRGNE